MNSSGLKEQTIEANKKLVRKETELIGQYARNHKMPFVTTPSGIWYHVYKHSASGDSIRDSMIVKVSYQLTLLDGTQVRKIPDMQPEEMIVGHDGFESGLHTGIKYLKRGDKAVVIIPSAQAHGLMGDMNNIPPQMPLVYDIWVR